MKPYGTVLYNCLASHSPFNRLLNAPLNFQEMIVVLNMYVCVYLCVHTCPVD